MTEGIVIFVLLAAYIYSSYKLAVVMVGEVCRWLDE